MPDAMIHDILAQPQMLQVAAVRHLQPASALDVAAQALRAAAPRRLILTGMGSSFFAAYPAALRLLGSGLPAIWIDLSELVHHGGTLDADTALVIVSQSGETVEAVRLLQAQVVHSPVVAITNNPTGTLARHATYVIETGAGEELTIATRTYTAALLALSLLAERMLGADLPALAAQLAPTLEAMQAIAERGEAQIAALPAVWRQSGPLSILGRGPSLATALSGGLLLKETAKLPAEGLSSAQFRHGPLEIAGAGHRAIICASSGPTQNLDLRLAADVQACGSDVLLCGPAINAPVAQITLPDVWLSPLLEILPLQFLARALAIARGLEPGVFTRITKVTTAE